MFKAQHHKCCYCERAPLEKHQDVEHYRPKSAYWWLAWEWSNLLFCCKRCNGHKADRFPLLAGHRLDPEMCPPGDEKPSILDPADPTPGADPIDHIVFRFTAGRWMPFPRNGSRRGRETIDTCKLHATDLLDQYRVHAEQISSVVKLLQMALKTRDRSHIQAEWDDVARRWLSRSQPLTALSRDILDHHLPPTVRERYGLSLELRPPLT